jgi:hypothetical protein
MKKIFGIIAVCILLFSCKKDHSKDVVPGNSVHKIGFNITFSSQTAPFRTNLRVKTNALVTNSLADSVKVIYYAVYDSVGNIVHTIKQLSTDAVFGSYTDNLHAGKYTIIVAAGQTGFTIGNPTPGGTVGKLSTDVLYYTSSNFFSKDSFYKELALTVTNTDSNNNVTLDRITSELTVNVTDQIPLGTKYLTLIITSGAAGSFKVGTGIASLAGPGFIARYVDTLKASDIGTKNYQASFIFLPLSSTITVQLTAENQPDGGPAPIVVNLVGQKVISGITCAPNTQTVISGELFGGNGLTGSGGFTSTLDTAWSSTTIVKTFP